MDFDRSRSDHIRMAERFVVGSSRHTERPPYLFRTFQNRLVSGVRINLAHTLDNAGLPVGQTVGQRREMGR